MYLFTENSHNALYTVLYISS